MDEAAAVVGQVELAGRVVSRLGVSLVEMQARGMWGEPSNRALALATIRRAVELGADAIEVPIPFGPAADLVRELGDQRIYVIARLTGELSGLDTLRSRLGRLPDMILAEERLLGAMSEWGIPLGVIVGPRTYSVAYDHLTAVRGPYPALERMVYMCELEGISYMAPALDILRAGQLTMALPPIASVGDVERVFAAAATPPT